MIRFKWFAISTSGVNFGRTDTTTPDWHRSPHFQVWILLSQTSCAAQCSQSHCSNITVDWFPSASLAESTSDQRKQSRHYSSAAFRNRSRVRVWPTSTNMKGFIYIWLSQLYFNDLNSSLCAAKGFALFGLQLGSDISDPRSLKNKAIKVCIRLRLCSTRKRSLWTWITLNWMPRPSFKIQSSMFTLFFIPLTCSFIVHCPGTPSPVSNLPLDWSCILLQSQLFIILSPAAAG